MNIKAKFHLLFYNHHSRSHEGGTGWGGLTHRFLLRFGPPYLTVRGVLRPGLDAGGCRAGL